MKQGKAFSLFLEEVQKAMASARQHPNLESYCSRLQEAVGTLKKVTSHLVDLASKSRPEVALADATLYLELFGYVVLGWQWLLQGRAAAQKLTEELSDQDRTFLEAKIYGMKYFFHYELPKIEGPAKRLMESEGLTNEIQELHFVD